MNESDLLKKISTKFTLNRTLTSKIWNFILGEITQDLKTGKMVLFRNFGTFRKVFHPKRRYFDPTTKKIKIKEPRFSVLFHPGKDLVRTISEKRHR